MRTFAPALAAAAALSLLACNRSATTPAKPTSANCGGDAVVASFGDQKITQAELDTAIASDLYRARRQGLETMVLRRLVAQEAKKAGKTEEALIQEIGQKAANEADEEALRRAYEQHQAELQGIPFEQAQPLLKNLVGQMAVSDYLRKLQEQAGVKITLPEPRAEVAADGPSKGPENAPVTIVEFSDFQCPYCAKAKQTMDQAVANYAGKIRLVFRHFPLPSHTKARKAAEASLCAHEQGKFWEMHDEMFDRQDKLDVPELKATAQRLGLDAAKFDSCLDSGKYAAKVQEDMDAGERAGVESTPAFFINGRLLTGALPYEEFKRVIDEELAAKK